MANNQTLRMLVSQLGKLNLFLRIRHLHCHFLLQLHALFNPVGGHDGILKLGSEADIIVCVGFE